MPGLATVEAAHSSDQIDRGGVDWRALPFSLAIKVLFVGVICHFSTQIGFAHKFPPHQISPLWPTGAILFSVLVVTPARQWWAYILAAYFTSVLHDIRAGFPLAAIYYIAAGLLEVLVATIGVRRFANGHRAFQNLHDLAIYFLVAVFLAPGLAGFVAALAGSAESYWFYWRVWFLSEGLAYLMLAPAILTWLTIKGGDLRNASWNRFLEAGIVLAGLLVVMTQVFYGATSEASSLPTLIYLPLPLLLWTAVRFGPRGVTASLLLVACISISGAVGGRGPFASGVPSENVLSLQLFLVTASAPLLFLAVLMEENHQKTLALGESEQRFRLMSDTAPVKIWIAEPDKNFSYFNKRWLIFTGQPLEKELGQGWLTRIHPDDRQRFWETYETAFESHASMQLEFRLQRHDGEYRWLINQGVPRFESTGQFVGYIGSCIDITDRKLADQELQEQRRELIHLSRVAILGELSGALAHELNQPLTAILSNAQAAQRFLSRDPIDLDEVQEILKDIVDEDKRAGEVLRRLRFLLKKGEISLQTLDLNELVREVIHLTHADIVSRNINMELNLTPDLPMVRGDRVQLQQVLLNLILNGCDAMKNCSPRDRHLTIITQSDGKDQVNLRLSDRGSGIAEENLDRVFHPFFTTKEHGLGLGLSICRSIVAAHGGSLSAANHPDGGAVFQLTLPPYIGDAT